MTCNKEFPVFMESRNQVKFLLWMLFVVAGSDEEKTVCRSMPANRPVKALTIVYNANRATNFRKFL